MAAVVAILGAKTAFCVHQESTTALICRSADDEFGSPPPELHSKSISGACRIDSASWRLIALPANTSSANALVAIGGGRTADWAAGSVSRFNVIGRLNLAASSQIYAATAVNLQIDTAISHHGGRPDRIGKSSTLWLPDMHSFLRTTRIARRSPHRPESRGTAARADESSCGPTGVSNWARSFVAVITSRSRTQSTVEHPAAHNRRRRAADSPARAS